MMLIIDIGNSCLKWAQLDKLGDIGHLNLLNRVSIQSHDLNAVFDENWSTLVEPDSVVFSTVVPEIGKELVAWCQKHWPCPVLMVRSTEKACGVQNAYHAPERLGVDRWAAVVAAYDKYKTDVCVVDCGTALTIDLVSASGKHAGGYIIPGLSSMQKSLNKATDAIQVEPSLHQGKNTHATAPGTSTEQAIAHGTILAAVGLIEQVINHYDGANGIEPICALTGGDAELLIPYLSRQVKHEPGLVLQGIVLLATETG